MSQSNFEIQFITSNPKNEISDLEKPIIHHKKSRKHKIKKVLSKEECEETEITWRLRKFIRLVESNGFDFTPKSASDRLTHEITAEKIVRFLNDKVVFDFVYEPSQNDELQMEINYVIENINGKFRRPYINCFVSFLFDGNQWVVNKGFDHIDYHYKEFKEGIIKYNLK